MNQIERIGIGVYNYVPAASPPCDGGKLINNSNNLHDFASRSNFFHSPPSRDRRVYKISLRLCNLTPRSARPWACSFRWDKIPVGEKKRRTQKFYWACSRAREREDNQRICKSWAGEQSSWRNIKRGDQRSKRAEPIHLWARKKRLL